VLLLFHPAGITPEVEYSVDQYLLKGGTVVACLDPYSVAAQMSDGGNPMMGQQGAPITSTLPTLLPAWGATFESTQVLADPTYATKIRGNNGLSVLTMGKSAMPLKDDVITKELESVTFFLPGAFTLTGANGIKANSLIQSTTDAGFVDGMRASRLDQTLSRTLKAGGTAYDLLTHLSGTFKTAFPDGKPKTELQGTLAPTDENAPKPESLKQGTAPGNVFLIADIDAFYDSFAYNVQNFGGTQMASPANGNSSLLLNLLDQAIGSKHLIGSRSRSASRRPFTVIQKMEEDFNKTVGAKIEEFQEKQRAAQEKLSALQAQKASGTELYLSPAQEEEIKKLRQEQVEYSKLIRAQEKELRRQKDQLAGRITLLNVAVMPTLVILTGLGLYVKRRSSTRAR
jgi:ABC-type uncharacterized transport system involved in gliding motility auxiliary subunit